MASTPDPTPPSSVNASQPINDRAAQLNAELEELRAKIVKVMQDSQDLLGELDGTESAGESA